MEATELATREGVIVEGGAPPEDATRETTSVLGVGRTDAGKCARRFLTNESGRPFSIHSLPLCAVPEVTPCEATTTRLDKPFCLAA
jgi:hypothetical protein